MIGEFIKMESQLCYLHFEWILCYMLQEKEEREGGREKKRRGKREGGRET